MEKLGIQPFNLIAQVINFLIIYFLLSRFLYQPILKMLDERKAKIKAVLDKEKRIEEELAGLQEVRSANKAKTEEEAREIINQAKEAIEKEKIEVKEKIREIIQEARKQARQEAEKEKDLLLAKFREQTAELVLLTTKQVLKTSLGAAEQKRIVKDALKEIKELKPNA